MNDVNANSKKPLPKRQQPASLLSEQAASAIFTDIPPLPVIADPRQRPCFFLIDDEPAFREAIRRKWQAHYPQAMELIVAAPDSVKSVLARINQHLQAGNRLDAIFIDKNLADGGDKSLAYLQQLRANPLTKYTPIAVITTSEFGTDEQERQRDLQYTEWLIYRKRASAGFLYHMATWLPSARESVEDRKWTDLIAKTADWISEQEMFAADGETRLFTALNDFFQEIFQFCTYFVSQYLGDRFSVTHDLPPCGPQATHFQEPFDPQSIPFLKNLTDQPQKIDALEANDIGSLHCLKGKPFLGCRLQYEGNVLGIIALFHHTDQPPFRVKDLGFLRHLALQLSAYLGWRQQQQTNSRRQQLLADFAQTAASAGTIDDLLSNLADLLHREVNDGDDRHAKTTIRRLEQASGQINRCQRRGLDSLHPTRLTLDSNNSLCAKALRERKSLRHGKLEQQGEFEKKLEYSKGIHSSLTVPILSGTQIFGGVNLEHQSSDKYDDNDELFVRMLCDLTAAAWMRLRQFNFQRELVDLLQKLWHEADFRTLQQQIYQSLQAFTGYALLLYLLPDANHRNGWRIEQLSDVDPQSHQVRDMPAEQADLWRQQFDQQWQRTFIGKTLSADSPQFAYIDGDPARHYRWLEPTASGEAFLMYSEAIIPISSVQNCVAAILLGFRLDKALTVEQQTLLAGFGQVIGDILQHLDQVKSMAERLQTAQAQAQLGFLYGQMRHVLTNQLGGIGNIFDQLQDDGADAAKLSLIRRTFDKVNSQLQAMRYLVNTPKFERVDLAALWHSLQADFEAPSAYPAELQPGEMTFTVCRSDAACLRALLFNLVLNAAQAGQKIDRPCQVTLSTVQQGRQRAIRIQDNGPGIPEPLRAQIFDPGVTTRSDGTGFGLHFCRFQAERLNMHISAENTAIGACFILAWQQEFEA